MQSEGHCFWRPLVSEATINIYSKAEMVPNLSSCLQFILCTVLMSLSITKHGTLAVLQATEMYWSQFRRLRRPRLRHWPGGFLVLSQHLLSLSLNDETYKRSLGKGDISGQSAVWELRAPLDTSKKEKTQSFPYGLPELSEEEAGSQRKLFSVLSLFLPGSCCVCRTPGQMCRWATVIWK